MSDRANPTRTVTVPQDQLSSAASDRDETAAASQTGPVSSHFAPPSEPGEVGTLGPYRVLKQLGAGGMGAVYLALDPRLDRKIALKVMLAEFAANADSKERFLREARAAAKISHDNVVTVFEADERDGVPYIAMQFLQGYPLDQFLKTKGVPPLPHVLRIARETALGLAAAHALGLVHRDIKPANLWLEAPNGRVKVLDFGLAKPVGSEAELTKSGAVIGTPAYMSPEQARGQKVDHRTDLFSLGAVLYRMCTGKTPFAGPNVMAVLMALGSDDPVPVRDLNPEVPESLAILIHQLLAKKPDERPQTATAVAKRLRAIQEELAVPVATAAPEVSNSLPVVMYAPPAVLPMHITMQPESAFADLDADDETHLERSAERSKPEKKPVGKGLWVAAAGAVLLTVFAVAGVIIIIKNKDGSTTKIEVPDDATVEVTKGGKTLGKFGPETKKAEPWQPAAAWQGIPVGESPFDKLDPSAIPKEERFDGQPKELVGVIGSHARRSWWNNKAAAFSPDGSLAATGSTDITIWDMKTQTPKMVIPSRNVGWGPDMIPVTSSIHFLPDGKRILCHRFANGTNVQLWDISGAEPQLLPFGKSEKAEPLWGNWWNARPLEKGDSAVALEHNGNLNLIDFRGAKPEVTVKDFPVLAGGDCYAVATETDQVFYVTNAHKLRRATVKNAKFENDQELPIPLGMEGSLKAVTADGKKIVVWAEKQIQVWDLSQNPPKIAHRIPEHQAFGNDSLVAISPDGKWLTSKYSMTALFRLDAEEPKRVAWLDETDAAGPYGSVAFSPDSTRVILGNSNGLVRFWDLSGKEPKELSPFDPATAFPAPTWLQTASLDAKQARLMLPRFDTQAGKFTRHQLWNFTGSKPTPVAFLDPDAGGPIHSLGQDRSVQIVPVDGHVSRLYRQKNVGFEQIGEPFGSPNTLGNVSPDGRTMISSPTDNPKQLESWDLSTDTPKQKWTITPKDHVPMGGGYGHKVWFSADNRWFTTQAKGEKDDGPWKLVLWRNTGAKPGVHAAIPIPCGVGQYGAALSPDGRYLAHTPTSPTEVVLLDLTGKEPREVAKFLDGSKINGDFAYLAFHPDSKKLAVSSDRGVCLLDVATMKSIWDWQSPGPVRWLDWAADGRHLVTHNGNLTVYVLRFPESVVGKAPLAGDADRKAAEYVLSIGGYVHVNDEAKVILAAADLPKEAFRLTAIGLYDNKQATDLGFPVFKNCKHLTSLYLQYANNIGDAGLAHFKDCKNLTHLNLIGTSVSDAGLAHFKDCKNLKHLNLQGTKVGDGGLASFKDSKSLTELYLTQTNVTDAGLAHFKDCKSLTSLGLGGTQVSDAGLAHFKDCKDLTHLILINTKVSDVGLENFKNCKNLTELQLELTQVTNAGLVHFKECKNLAQLNLAQTAVTDEGLKHFRDCKNLEVINLNHLPVTDAGLAIFKDCTELRHLALYAAKVTGAGFARFKSCKNLVLGRTQVTDAELMEIAGMDKLISLELIETKVTAKGVEGLSKALPKCKIVWDGGTIEPK